MYVYITATVKASVSLKGWRLMIYSSELCPKKVKEGPYGAEFYKIDCKTEQKPLCAGHVTILWYRSVRAWSFYDSPDHASLSNVWKNENVPI